MSQETRKQYLRDLTLHLLNDLINFDQSDMEYVKAQAKTIKHLMEVNHAS